MKYLFSILIIAQAFVLSAQPNSSVEDLNPIYGKWEGSLTYIDYQSGKPYTMKANLEVTEKRVGYLLLLKNSYPSEASANNTDKFKLSKSGKKINGHKIVSKSFNNGELKIITEYKGKDDRKKGIIRYTYSITSNTFSIEKTVRFEGETDWITRNIYSYTKS